ncbi:MAG: hypothetical protein ACKV19_15435 [Verrucomicrobiales bacterium]
MKAPILIHGLWLVLAAGAFAVGRWTVTTPSAKSGGSHVATVVTPPPSPTAARSAESAEAARAAALSEDPAAWAARFRSADGTISAAKMSEAVREALREPDPVKSMMNFSQLIKELSPENADAAFKTVRETVTGFDSMRFLPMLTYQWGTLDGAKALSTMQELGGRDGMFNSAATLAGFASADPEAAKKWLTENGTNENRWILDRALVTGLARSDFAAASEYVMALPAENRAGFVEVLAEQKIRDGISPAADWALALTDPAMKASALQRVADQYTRQDPAQAAAWIQEHATADYAKDAVATVARKYAEKDPQLAIGWAATLPAGVSQNEAYGRVFREWGRSDPTSASEALNSLPTGAAKDESIGSFARSIARDNPEDAVTWAATISNAQQREQAQIEVVQRWRGTDADAASQWASANLSPEAQKKVNEPPRWDRGGGSPFGGMGGPGGGPPPGSFR